jgi:hypothetical protein
VTLLLTECSASGIAMAADSAITKFDSKGRIIEVDQSGWRKILRAPRIVAAVGYWGFIGKIYHGRFDEWLHRTMDGATYSDVPSLAAALAAALNKACKSKPLDDGQSAGLHVAGFHPWKDGNRRPFFFHVNNGPGGVHIQEMMEGIPRGERLIEVRPKVVAGPRDLFKSHQDFPREDLSLEENLDLLKGTYTTRNGDFFYYAVVWDALQRSFNYLNLIQGFSIPRDQSLGARRGLLHVALETTVRVYRCSNQSRIVGGKVISEAIGPDGWLNQPQPSGRPRSGL